MEIQYIPKAPQLLGAHYLRVLGRFQTKIRKSGRKPEITILSKIRPGFFRFVGFHRNYNPGLAKTAELIYRLLNKSNNFYWSAEWQNFGNRNKEEALEHAKYALTADA